MEATQCNTLQFYSIFSTPVARYLAEVKSRSNISISFSFFARNNNSSRSRHRESGYKKKHEFRRAWCTLSYSPTWTTVRSNAIQAGARPVRFHGALLRAAIFHLLLSRNWPKKSAVSVHYRDSKPWQRARHRDRSARGCGAPIRRSSCSCIKVRQLHSLVDRKSGHYLHYCHFFSQMRYINSLLIQIIGVSPSLLSCGERKRGLYNPQTSEFMSLTLRLKELAWKTVSSSSLLPMARRCQIFVARDFCLASLSCFFDKSAFAYECSWM